MHLISSILLAIILFSFFSFNLVFYASARIQRKRDEAFSNLLCRCKDGHVNETARAEAERILRNLDVSEARIKIIRSVVIFLFGTATGIFLLLNLASSLME